MSSRAGGNCWAVGCMACLLRADVGGAGMGKDAGTYSALAEGLVKRGEKTVPWLLIRLYPFLN